MTPNAVPATELATAPAARLRRVSEPTYLAQSPKASVLVLGFRRPQVGDAVRAVTAGTSRTSFETLLLLNGATDQVAAAVSAAKLNARVESSPANLGFAAGVNLLARKACGDYLILLNDDAIPRQGWLDRLVSTADEMSEVGIVTSRLVFSDGRLQEAGGIISSTGEPEQVGWGRRDHDARLDKRRDVDYGSAAALLVRREAFEQVGGFDERYFPAYFEDVDLALRIRQAGWRVVYEPRAIVEHAQWGSTNPAQRSAAYRYNKGLFRRQWQESLRSRASWAPDGAAAETGPASRGLGAQPWERYANWLAGELFAAQDRLEKCGSQLGEARAELGEIRAEAVVYRDGYEQAERLLADCRRELALQVGEVHRLRAERHDIESLWMMRARRSLSRRLRSSAALGYVLDRLHRRAGGGVSLAEEPEQA